MITSLSLTNFKCFKEKTTFRLGNITILAGYNGTGKSSICQALLMLAQSLDNNGQLKSLHANGDFVNLGKAANLANFDNPSNKIGIAWTTDQPSGHKVIWEFKVNKDSYRRDAQIDSLFKDGINQKEEVKGIKDVITGVESSDQNKATLNVDDWSFMSAFDGINYISADRRGPTLFEQRSDLKRRNPLGTMGEHKLEAMLPVSDATRAQIQKALSFIMGRVIKIDINTDNTDSDVLSLWYADNSGNKVNCVNTGFGFTYVLSLLICLYSNHNSIIIIENPEAHLHPQAQSRLMMLMAIVAKENGNQLIVETHSENVLNGLRLAVVKEECPISKSDIAIHFFDIVEKPQELTIGDDSQISPWPKGFFDQIDDDLTEILNNGMFKTPSHKKC